MTTMTLQEACRCAVARLPSLSLHEAKGNVRNGLRVPGLGKGFKFMQG